MKNETNIIKTDNRIKDVDKLIYKISILVCLTWTACAFIDYFAAKKDAINEARVCDFKINAIKNNCKG